MNDELLTQRLRAASETIEMSEHAQARHLEAIAAALSGDNVTPLPSTAMNRRRRFVASIVAAAVIAPAGLAAASEDSVPGDALYGVKQVSERVLVLFDSDVIARHRIEELEALESRGEATSDLYELAVSALTELDEDHSLWQRLEASPRFVAEAVGEDDPFADDDRSIDDTPRPPTTIDVTLPDGSTAVVSVEDGRITEVETPTGWAVVEIDGDEVTVRSARHEVELELLDNGELRSTVIDDFGSIGDDSESDDALLDDTSRDVVTNPGGSDSHDEADTDDLGDDADDEPEDDDSTDD